MVMSTCRAGMLSFAPNLPRHRPWYSYIALDPNPAFGDPLGSGAAPQVQSGLGKGDIRAFHLSRIPSIAIGNVRLPTCPLSSKAWTLIQFLSQQMQRRLTLASRITVRKT